MEQRLHMMNITFNKRQIDKSSPEEVSQQLSKQSISEDVSSHDSSIDTTSTTSSDAVVQSCPGTGVTVRSLIANPSIHFEFYVDNDYPRIACVEKGLAWVETNYSTLQLLDKDGSAKETVFIDFNIWDISLASDGRLILADMKNKSIKSLSKRKEISTLFETSWKPISLCCLLNDDIVVSFSNERKVVIYCRAGQIRRTLDHIKFSYPCKVSANKLNQDIFICDQTHNYSYEGKLVAVGVDGELRFEYCGQGKTFSPAYVCSDWMGQILITDIDNHKVHILDKEGQLLQHVLTSQLMYPNTIDVDREGNIWVGEEVDTRRGCVKVAKYLQ